MLRIKKSKCSSVSKNIIKISKKYQSKLDKQAMKLKIQFHKCSICLSYIDKNDKHFLPCCHYYHVTCIEPWLQKNITCPICKMPVFIQTYDQYIEYNKFLTFQRNNLDNTENILSGDHNMALLFIKKYRKDIDISTSNANVICDILEDGLNLEYINSDKVKDMCTVSDDITARYLQIFDNGYESDISISSTPHSQNQQSNT